MLLESFLIEPTEDATMKLIQEQLLSSGHQDNVKDTIKKDKLILLYGATLFRKLGKDSTNDIYQRRGQLARLCQEMSCTLDEALHSQKFDAIISAIEKPGNRKIVDGHVSFGVPSLAL